MKKKLLKKLGQQLYSLYRENRVEFIYSTEGQNLELEIERISQLIDYVNDKKHNLQNQTR